MFRVSFSPTARENEDMRVTDQEFRRACDTVIAFTDQHEPLTVQDFRHACDSVVTFMDQHEHLTNQQHRLIFTVVESLANTLAPSSKPEEKSPVAVWPLID